MSDKIISFSHLLWLSFSIWPATATAQSICHYQSTIGGTRVEGRLCLKMEHVPLPRKVKEPIHFPSVAWSFNNTIEIAI